jgi:hypothetical protein
LAIREKFIDWQDVLKRKEVAFQLGFKAKKNLKKTSNKFALTK